MEEKKLTDEEIVKALEHCATENTCRGCVKYNGEPTIDYFKCMRDTKKKVVDLFHRLQGENAEQKAEIERLTEEKEDLYFQNKNLQTYIDNHEPIWKRNTERAVKDTAKEILDELDLFFKGTTFRKGYEFKKIDRKLKEMAQERGLEVE